MNHSVKIAGIMTLMATALVLGGCAEYTARNEFLSPNFGKALASNTAMQTVNLNPAAAQNTRLKTDGTIATNAIETYRTPVIPEGQSTTTTASAIAPISN